VGAGSAPTRTFPLEVQAFPRSGADATVRLPAVVAPFIDNCGPRVSELETCEIGDVDEHRRAIRVRWTFEKNERYRHLELPDDLLAALLATLPPREDRDLAAPLFPDLTDAR
jgi:integrase